jgi:hypothetical protein
LYQEKSGNPVADPAEAIWEEISGNLAALSPAQ